MSLILNVTIEIPKNSKIKYEYNRKDGSISVDRILFGPSGYPQNYGFIKEALDWDGDELDCLVISDQEFLPGVIVPTRIIGAMEMIDGGETDTKLIGVIDCDPRYSHINSTKDINQHLFTQYDRVENIFPTLIPAFDRSPRAGKKAHIWTGSTPELFRDQLLNALSLIENKLPEHKILFLQSWNEWGESNYVEPDLKYGHGFLDVLKECLIESK